jgi:hypothetical protein
MLAVAVEIMPPKAVILAADRGERLRPLLVADGLVLGGFSQADVPEEGVASTGAPLYALPGARP